MKKYLLFAGDNYYPAGDWKDFIDDYDKIEQAKDRLSRKYYDWWQIVDSETYQIIDE